MGSRPISKPSVGRKGWASWQCYIASQHAARGWGPCQGLPGEVTTACGPWRQNASRYKPWRPYAPMPPMSGTESPTDLPPQGATTHSQQ